ncbi:MAG: hypothetical protein KDA42_18355, partial [Planctomycetales bacterium]|nr:hypothetical protein [Planctomycetales bacterium]
MQRLSPICALIVATVSMLGASFAHAADPAFVGILALAVDEEVSRSLELSADVRHKLTELIDQREDAALELALSIKDLPEPERQQRLAPFRDESERLGLALLTTQQQQKLKQTQIARRGMAG